MSNEKGMRGRHLLMTRMMEDYQKQFVAAIIKEKEDPEDPDEPEVLTLLLDHMGSGSEECLEELWFQPFTSEEDELQFFTALIRFVDDLKEETLPALYEAVSRVNFRLPCGCFVMDRAGSFLSFRLTVPLPMDMEKESLYQEMHLIAGNAAAICDMHCGALLDVLRGDAGIDDVMRFLE